MQRDRSHRTKLLRIEALETRIALSADGLISMRHNALLPTDVDMDGSTSPLDALVVINEINSKGSYDANQPTMSDTNNDGFISPLDVLMVINDLNSGSTGGMDGSFLPLGSGSGSGSGSGDLNDKPPFAVDDTLVEYLSAKASSKSAIRIDALVNDEGNGLRIVDVSAPATGTATIQTDPIFPSRTIIVYTPNVQSANYDRFQYTIEDDRGLRSEASVSVLYEQSTDGVRQFELQLPDRVVGSIGETIEFRDTSRAPQIKINYDGDPAASVGVYLSWSPPEGYYIGDRFVGEIGTTAAPETASFYPAAGGAAWIYGDVPGVNRILANLYYEPSAGFSAPEGISLVAKAFLYSEIGINIGTQFGSTVVVVNKDSSAPGPHAVDDFFRLDASTTVGLIEVLENDVFTGIADPSSILVDVTPAAHSDALIEWDPIARKIRYQDTGYGFRGFDQFAYTLRTPSGVTSRAIVTVLLK